LVAADTVTVDEESGLANTEETCKYCEETGGYAIKGVVAPYEDNTTADSEVTAQEADAELEEGIFGIGGPSQKQITEYKAAIKKIFKLDHIQVANEVYKIATTILHQMSNDHLPQAEQHSQQVFKKIIADVTKPKGINVINKLLSYSRSTEQYRELDDGQQTEKLQDLFKKTQELRRVHKIGEKANDFLNTKVAEFVHQRIKNYKF